MEIRDVDAVENHMHNVRVVPYTFGSQAGSSYHHSVDGVIVQAIAHHQGAMVTEARWMDIRRSRRAAPIFDQRGVERVNINANGRPQVMTQDIVDQHRLGPAHKDGSFAVEAPPESRLGTLRVVIHGLKSVVIEFQDRSADPRIGLMDLDDVKSSKCAF